MRGKFISEFMSKTFFQFRQNNSGGHFNGPAARVIVEAPDKKSACALTEPHFTLCGTSGAYAEYDSCGCCPCCGHRWSEQCDDEPEANEKIAKRIKEDGISYMGAVANALVKADGSVVVGNTPENIEAICNYISR